MRKILRASLILLGFSLIGGSIYKMNNNLDEIKGQERVLSCVSSLEKEINSPSVPEAEKRIYQKARDELSKVYDLEKFNKQRSEVSSRNLKYACASCVGGIIEIVGLSSSKKRKSMIE